MRILSEVTQDWCVCHRHWKEIFIIWWWILIYSTLLSYESAISVYCCFNLPFLHLISSSQERTKSGTFSYHQMMHKKNYALSKRLYSFLNLFYLERKPYIKNGFKNGFNFFTCFCSSNVDLFSGKETIVETSELRQISRLDSLLCARYFRLLTSLSESTDTSATTWFEYQSEKYHRYIIYTFGKYLESK